MKESILYFLIKVAARFLYLLPINVALGLGKCIGWLGYVFSFRRKKQVYVNLRTAFCETKSIAEIKRIIPKVFINSVQNIVELLRLSRLSDDEFRNMVQVEGEEYAHEALKKNKGLIIFTMHFGSWELANRRLASMDFTYKMFVRDQHRYVRLDELLNSYRSRTEGDVLDRDGGLRNFINSFKNNEVVGMVGDQGGKAGVHVKLFGRKMSLSTGAIKMAMKSGVPLMFGIIKRNKDGKHTIVLQPPLAITDTGDLKKDLAVNLSKLAALMEKYITEYPWEYMWFYKLWKYSTQRNIMVLNDGRMGHLRQSESLLAEAEKGLERKGFVPEVRVVDVQFKGPLSRSLFVIFGKMYSLFCGVSTIKTLKHFVTQETYEQLVSMKADIVISCGSAVSGVNYFVAHDCNARSFILQKPGLLWPMRNFDVVVLPQHDVGKRTFGRNVVVTSGAPNIVTAEYLHENKERLLNRYSHLKTRSRINIGLFIGGDSKKIFLSEHQIRVLVHQLKGIAKDINADLLVTTSRRTPTRIETILFKELKKDDHCPLLIVANQENIPEAVGGILGLSDMVIVSADSISMVSEAASSGKNVIAFMPEERVQTKYFINKHKRFVDRLNEEGYVLSVDVQNIGQMVLDVFRGKMKSKPLDDAKRIAEKIYPYL